MNTGKTHTINYRKLATEFTVIVIGVFIALAAESWWSEREERQFERELREDMVEEFKSNIDILQADISENEAQSKKLYYFAVLTETELMTLSNEYLNAEYSDFINWAGFDPVLGNVQALVDSGNLNVISDRKLRLLLSRWYGLLIMGKRFNLQAVTFQFQILEARRSDITSDLVWSETERRKLKSGYKMMTILHGSVILNQKELLATAQEISDYLASTM